MESNSVIAVPRPWLWPNLLSLDAPLVAVLWQLLFARCFHAGVDATATALLVLSVWLIYAADRMLDAFSTAGIANARLPRHEFYRRHWRAVLPVWSAVFLLAAWLACTRLAAPLFERGVALAAIVALYFTFVHLLQPAWPKELAVAVVFALGASVAAWNDIRTPADIEAIALFSCLCWINCVAIEQWEQRVVGWPVGMAAALVAGAAVLIYAQRPAVSAAEIASALAFVLLDQKRGRFSADALRVLADAALLTPILFLPLSGMAR